MKIPFRKTPSQRLADTLRPDPESRARRLAQWPRERRERYYRANRGLVDG